MPEDIELNRQALADIINDLAEAGFIRQSFLNEGGEKLVGGVTFSEAGTAIIAAYTKAFGAIRNFDERHMKVFHSWMDSCAVDYARSNGLIQGGLGDDEGR